ncbi:MAG: DUF3800 domain-containing protein [Polyangiaceae bacterium]|nr:DUF3800 domain-containing protein [Polyangiaceae bacterium]
MSFVKVAYVDESGDDGPHGSQSYALGCVIVDSAEWAETFDGLIAFRRFVRARFDIPVRAELKANYLLRNGGPLRACPLSEIARFKLYRGCMRVQPKLGVSTFAVVIDKRAAISKFEQERATSDIAWEYLLQRLERSFRGTEVLLFHDEGDPVTIRKRVRKARRAGSAGSAFGTGLLQVPFRNLLDDAIERDSRQSFFVQLADLAAYAAFRRIYPPPQREVPIVPQGMWDELGAARMAAVRNLQRYPGPVGIVPGP